MVRKGGVSGKSKDEETDGKFKIKIFPCCGKGNEK